MDRKDLLASVLIDEAYVAAMMPWACPCDFGPDGRYRLQELVGVGRDSLIYRAHDRKLSSEGFSAEVTVKIMRSGGAEREALTIRRVVHPNVLRVFDRGTDHDTGCPYLVTEFLSGGDLSQKPVPMELPAAVRFMVKVAGGVQAAHSAGVVHCDLKPANILLTGEGEPKVADFDLSRSVLSGPDQPRGNIAFMSPEQFAEAENALSPPSDVYALGGLLYHLLTGKLPNGETREQIAAAHAGLGVRRARVDTTLDRIVDRAMARLAEERYTSAGQFADDLQRWLGHEPIEWLRPGLVCRARLWTIRRPLAAAVFVLTTAALVGAPSLYAYNRVKDFRREQLAQVEAQRRFDEELARARSDIQSSIRTITAATLGTPSNDRMDRLLPTLVVMEFISGTPMLGENGRVALASDRITLLQSEVEWLKARGRGEHLDVCLVRYALAYFLASEDRGAEAEAVLNEVEPVLLARTVADDPLREGLEAIRACAAALQCPRGEAMEARVSLSELAKRMGRHKRTEPVRRLVQRTLARIEANAAGPERE